MSSRAMLLRKKLKEQKEAKKAQEEQQQKEQVQSLYRKRTFFRWSKSYIFISQKFQKLVFEFIKRKRE